MNLKYWIALVAVVAGTAGYAYHRDLAACWRDYLDSQKETQAIEREHDALRAERDKLKEDVQRLKTDPVEVEQSIRQNKNLVREGEKVYRVDLPPQ